MMEDDTMPPPPPVPPEWDEEDTQTIRVVRAMERAVSKPMGELRRSLDKHIEEDRAAFTEVRSGITNVHALVQNGQSRVQGALWVIGAASALLIAGIIWLISTTAANDRDAAVLDQRTDAVEHRLDRLEGGR